MTDNRQEAANFLQEQLHAEVAARLNAEAQAEALRHDIVALKQEFGSTAIEDMPKKIREQLQTRYVNAFTILDHYLEHGKESTRVGIAKWMIDRGLVATTDGDSNTPESELAKMLERLSD